VPSLLILALGSYMKVLQLQYTVRLFQVRGIPGILIYRNVNVYIETYINIICELELL
jgi:hypothetical protein